MKWKDARWAVLLLTGDIALPWAGRWLLALVWWAVHAILYGWSIWRRPVLRCWRCGGSGSHNKDRIWTWGQGDCLRCGTQGRYLRFGVKVLTPGRAARLRAKYRIQQGRVPRRLAP